MRCVIICGAPHCSPELIKSTVSSDDYVICADKGYKYALKAEVSVDLIIGDFDSYNEKLPEDIEIIRLNTHKDDSDSMHCAEVALDMGFSDIILLGALGGRNDHSFANFCVLSYLAENGAAGTLIDDREKVVFLRTGSYEFNDLSGTTFSVFPFGCSECVVTYEGDCEYPAQNLALRSTESLGLSNIFRSNNVRINVQSGTCLVFIETVM